MTETFAEAARALAQAACGRLGWSPDAFWAATPADLALTVEGLAGPAEAGLSRAEMTALMEQDDG
jgi:hypothetical protein